LGHGIRLSTCGVLQAFLRVPSRSSWCASLITEDVEGYSRDGSVKSG
jgi:hypothetical protein